jgi:hypothetical protein
MVFAHGHRRSVARDVGVFLLICFYQFPCDAKIVPRRDPLDAALDSTVIAIMRQQSPGTFQVEEAFLGDVAKGQTLLLPGFNLVVQDTSSLICCRERIEPIRSSTRILVFLKPASTIPGNWQRYGQWAVAGFGNCYFWSHDPDKLDPLREMAKKALALRNSWETARNLPDKWQRTEALWPYLWDYSGSCYKQTEAALQEIGAVAGDYIAGRLESMTYRQKDVFLNDFAMYGSVRLHQELVLELKRQQREFEKILRSHGAVSYDEIDPPGRMRYYPRRPEDAEADKISDIYGVLYQGFVGLGRFHDRNDLPFIRAAAVWGLNYRFKQLDDAALLAFASMPDKENLALIESIWKQYSSKQFVGNELQPHDIIRTLGTHRFPEAIPLMARFVNAGFMQDAARQFLVEMTGIDLGGDEKRWLDWYESHKRELGVRN